ncbi:MAG: DUF2330 domain-containing protein [Planctomycetes bacterium]|nr:DUF2330 domain-containing protein [Planctomycetota bacterium]
MRGRTLVLCVLVAAGAAGSARGLIVLPDGTGPRVTLVEVEELVIYHKQRQELIVRATLDLPANAAGVDRLAFIIPIPSVPEYAGFEDSSALSDLGTHHRRAAGGLRRTPEIDADYEPTQAVISPEKNRPVSEALNAWLALNGLGTIDAGKLKYYDERGWSFVVQRVSIGPRGGRCALRPVRISFANRCITFPLRMMAGEQPFSCRLFLMTKNNLDVTPLEDYGFTVVGGPSRPKLKQLPESVGSLVSRVAGGYGVFKEFKRGRIYLFAAAADIYKPNWPAEVELPSPQMSVVGMIQNILAAAAAATAVIMVSRASKKPYNK